MKIGLALSGGGARGIAHLGVLQAFDEAGIKFDMISGASAGSIAAAFYAYGYSPKETLAILEKTNLLKIAWPAFSTTGLLNIERSEQIYAKYLTDDSFSKMKVPLNIAVTNLNSGKAEIFNSGSVRKAIMASCCIPMIFDPIKINNQYYVDGGIVNNMPTEVLLHKGCEYIIGVNVVPIVPEDTFDGPKKMFERVSMLALSANVEMSAKLCDFYLNPKEIRRFGTFDFKKSKELFEIGYENAKYHLEILPKKDKLWNVMNPVQ
jgi:NTE family protein